MFEWLVVIMCVFLLVGCSEDNPTSPPLIVQEESEPEDIKDKIIVFTGILDESLWNDVGNRWK